MKKDRNMAPYPTYPPYGGMTMPMMPMNTMMSPSMGNNLEQINYLEQQINSLEKRVSRLERASSGGTYNKFSETENNYHMM